MLRTTPCHQCKSRAHSAHTHTHTHTGAEILEIRKVWKMPFLTPQKKTLKSQLNSLKKSRRLPQKDCLIDFSRPFSGGSKMAFFRLWNALLGFPGFRVLYGAGGSQHTHTHTHQSTKAPSPSSLGNGKCARTFSAQTFWTPARVWDIPAKFPGQPRFLPSKRKEDELSREGANFRPQPLRVEDPHPTGRSPDPKS